MLKVKINDIFKSECNTLVNTVNCIGVMGKGIAKIFKQKYPDMYKDYVDKCNSNLIKPGVPYYYSDLTGVSIINFPTKDHWRSPSRLSYIIDGLDWFVKNYKKLGIISVAFPPLGCGNGGLDWQDVGPIMYNKLKDIPIDVEIYAPFGTSLNHITKEFLLKNNSEVISSNGNNNLNFRKEWIIILETIYTLHQNPFSLYIGRTIYQKMCYIITELGINTGFRFKQGTYGPYSEDAKNALIVFANNNLIIEENSGNMIRLIISDSYTDFRHKYIYILNKYIKQTNEAIDLFSRLKNTEQAEIVTTVLYAAKMMKKKNITVNERQIYEYVINWKKHWKTEDKEIAVSSSIRNLSLMGFIDAYSNNELPYSNLLE